MVAIDNRQLRAPRERSAGTFRALLVCLSAFVALMWLETQWLAHVAPGQFHGLRAWFGHVYAPWASLECMYRSGFFNPFVSHGSRVDRLFARESRVLMIGLGICYIGFLVLEQLWSRARPASSLHGDARWATKADVRRSGLYNRRHGVVLGQTEPHELLLHDGTENVLVLGPPGVGKSDGTAAPTLSHGWPYSVITFDPARELVARTASKRRAFGQVYIFEPKDPRSARFNPLGGIYPEDVDAVRTVISSFFAVNSALMKTDASEFFINSAAELTTAVAIHMIDVRDPTLAGVDKFLNEPDWSSDLQWARVLGASRIPYVRETGAKFVRMDPKLRSDIHAVATQRLEIFR